MNGTTPSLTLKLKGYTEPVANFAFMGGSLLTSSASKVSLVSLQEVILEKQYFFAKIILNNLSQTGMMQVNPSKLQNSKTDRITAMMALPFHRFFLLGTEGKKKILF